MCVRALFPLTIVFEVSLPREFPGVRNPPPQSVLVLFSTQKAKNRGFDRLFDLFLGVLHFRRQTYEGIHLFEASNGGNTSLHTGSLPPLSTVSDVAAIVEQGKKV